MRRFVINTLLFALLVALTLAAGEVLVRNSTNSYSYKNQYILDNGSKISTLILGDSHNYYAINPAVLGDSAFNLANVSQNYEYDYRLLEHYLPYLPNLKTVVLSLSYHSLRDPLFEEGDEWWMANNYKIYMDIDKHSDFSRYNFEISQPDIFSGRVRRALFGGKGMCDTLGLSLDNSPEFCYSGWESESASKARKQTIADTRFVTENTKWLDRLCRLCHEYNLRTYLLITPLYEDYRRNMSSQQVAELYDVARLMYHRYGVILLDFMNDPDFNHDDFFDADHLNHRGAERLSLRLKQILQP